MTRAGHATKNAVLHGILSSGRPVVEYTSAVEALEDAPSRHVVVFVGEFNRGGGVAVVATNLLRYEEARR